MSDTNFIILRYNGCIHKIRRVPFELYENSMARAWYIVKSLPQDMPMMEKESRSHIWFNTKYFGMKYNEV